MIDSKKESVTRVDFPLNKKFFLVLLFVNSLTSIFANGIILFMFATEMVPISWLIYYSILGIILSIAIILYTFGEIFKDIFGIADNFIEKLDLEGKLRKPFYTALLALYNYLNIAIGLLVIWGLATSQLPSVRSSLYYILNGIIGYIIVKYIKRHVANNDM